MEKIKKILSNIDDNIGDDIDILIDFLKIKSISTIPEYSQECFKAAEWLKKHLQSFGLNTIIYESEGHPIVYCEYVSDKEDTKTILFYGHYDVQPVDPIELWNSDPFTPTITEIDGQECIVARGASDDKGQLLTFVQAIKYFIDEYGELPFSMKLIIEGEEECGSKTLPKFLDEYRDKLSANIAYVCDTSMWDKDTPAITRSLRGLLSEEFEIIGPNRDLHSGEYGGVAWNPIRIISDIISKIYTDSGEVAIEGFYDGVKEVDKNILESWNNLNFNRKEYLLKIGQETSSGEKNRSIFEQTWSRPTFEINGILGGYTDQGTKTVIPSKASAKITCRLVGNQEPDKIIDNIHSYINKMLPEGVVVNFKGSDYCKAIEFDTNSYYFKSASLAIEEEWDVPPVYTGGGGSIPIVEVFKSMLNIDTVLVGFALDDDRIHSPNEKYNVLSYTKGIKTWVRIIEKYI
jgi:acetylornithine deacetylase/succinyl-diaminopimelate desuccinylase-like protein